MAVIVIKPVSKLQGAKWLVPSQDGLQHTIHHQNELTKCLIKICNAWAVCNQDARRRRAQCLGNAARITYFKIVKNKNLKKKRK